MNPHVITYILVKLQRLSHIRSFMVVIWLLLRSLQQRRGNSLINKTKKEQKQKKAPYNSVMMIQCTKLVNFTYFTSSKQTYIQVFSFSLVPTLTISTN